MIFYNFFPNIDENFKLKVKYTLKQDQIEKFKLIFKMELIMFLILVILLI